MKRHLGWAMGMCILASACASNEDPSESESGDESTRVPRCGDGILDAGEICEGFELRGATCLSEGFDSGALSCSADCTLDTSGCGRCGDGVIDADEVCEPGMAHSETCSTQLGPGFVGEVACDPTCTGFTSNACQLDFAAGALEACNPESSEPCSSAAEDCVAFGDQAFCAETCAEESKLCGVGRFCYDFEGQGICLDTPDRGEVCTSETGCTGRTLCTPTFDGQGQVSTCASPCASSTLGSQAECDSELVCLATPTSEYAFVTDIACERDFDCDPFAGFECADEGFCAQPHTACAERISFFPFDGTAADEELFCERDAPGGRVRLCGVEGQLTDSTLIRARVECVSLINESDPVGVCVGFCDPEIIGGGNDGFCGAEASCVDPGKDAQFYIVANEDEPVKCSVSATSCLRTNYTECVDVGRGPECARAARICREDAQ